MLKRSITYTDFNGVEVTEDFYFNLTKAEIVELEVGHEGGLSESLKAIVAAGDGKKIMEEFKNFILKSYGQRSADGKRFIKNQTIRDEFESTEAYSELFMSIVTDPEVAAEFISGIMPQDLMRQAQLTLDAEEEEVKAPRPKPPYEDPEEVSEPGYIPPAEPTIVSREESRAMDSSQLTAGVLSGSIKIRLTESDIREMDPTDLADGLVKGHYVTDVTP